MTPVQLCSGWQRPSFESQNSPGAQTTRTAGRRDALPVAIGIRAGLGHAAEVVIGIGGDEDIQAARQQGAI